MSSEKVTMSEDEEGLCNNCGAFTKLYEGGLCEYCYDANIDEQNSYAYGEGEKDGISIEEQHIDDYVPFGKGLGYALEKIIPYEYDSKPQDCLICMEQIKKGDTVVSLPCFHIFHGNCIYSWLKHNEDCPVCRSSVYNK